MKKILVVCPLRVGSTYFCNMLAAQHQLPVLPELFNISDKLRMQQAWQDKDNFYKMLKIEQQTESTISELYHTTEWVAKAVPYYIWWQSKRKPAEFFRIFSDVHSLADQVYYLYRQDFQEHVRSTCASMITKRYFADRTPDHIQMSGDEIRSYENRIKQHWKLIRDLYKVFPGTLVKMEDLPGQRYNQVYTFSPEFDQVSDFNISREVFGL
jgi:hypothetical protein